MTNIQISKRQYTIRCVYIIEDLKILSLWSIPTTHIPHLEQIKINKIITQLCLIIQFVKKTYKNSAYGTVS